MEIMNLESDVNSDQEIYFRTMTDKYGSPTKKANDTIMLDASKELQERRIWEY